MTFVGCCGDQAAEQADEPAKRQRIDESGAERKLRAAHVVWHKLRKLAPTEAEIAALLDSPSGGILNAQYEIAKRS